MTLFKNKEPKDPNILARLKALAEPQEAPEPIVIDHENESATAIETSPEPDLSALVQSVDSPEQPEPEPDLSARVWQIAKKYRTGQNPPGTPCPVCGKVLRRPKRHKCPGVKTTVSIPSNFTGTVEPAPEPVVIEGSPQVVEYGVPCLPQFKPTFHVAEEDETQKPTPAGAPVFDLWIDVVVAQSEDLETTTLFDFLDDCARELCEVQRVPHWKCVPFGQGPGLLVAACEKKIKESLDLGILICSSASMEFRACEGVLRRHAKNIVLGMR